VEAWLLVGLTTVFALFSGLTGSSGGTAHFAHLGGYVGAYLYLLALDRFSPARQFRSKVAKVAPTTEKVLKANWRNVNLEGVHQLSREEVNRILDKINAEGIGSLSAEEKLFLSNFVPPDDRKSWTS
jgi:enoyl-CoA hydratase/carnithine racemase